MSLDPAAKRQFKDQVYELFAGVGKALSNAHRLEVIDLLCQTQRSVEELAYATGMSMANASQHLQILRRAGLVAAQRQGSRVIYRIANDAVIDLWRSLRSFAEAELPAIEQVIRTYLENRADLEAISVAELRERMQDGSVVLLDVRPFDEFASGHIPGARSIPLDELARRINELPDDKELVAYCRGRYCVYSDEAVEILKESGREARRLELSVHDWRSIQ